MSRLLNPKVYDDQNQIIIDKYNAGWRIVTIAGYIGISASLVCIRLRALRRDSKLEGRRRYGHRLEGN